MSIGVRLADTLKGAGLSPRNLAAVTEIHYTTIYKLIAAKENAKTLPVMESVLGRALTKIEQYIELGVLPIREIISDKEKTERLKYLLADND
jgi:transposase